MSLKFREVPQNVSKVVAEKISTLANTPTAPAHLHHAMRMDLPGEVTFTQPHVNYFVSLDELLATKSLTAAARPTTWRFLTSANAAEQPTAEAEVAFDADPQAAPRFLNFTVSPFAAPSAQAFNECDGFPELVNSQYEPRLINIPAIYTVLIWFAGDHDHRFLLLSLPPKGLQQSRLYTESELLPVLLPLAQRTAEFAERPHNMPANVAEPPTPYRPDAQ